MRSSEGLEMNLGNNNKDTYKDKKNNIAHSDIFKIGRFYKMANNESQKYLRYNSVLQIWTDVSKINYISTIIFDDISKDHGLPMKVFSRNSSGSNYESAVDKTDDIKKKFPEYLTSLIDETNLWGCFYNFPELYEDVHSPVVRINNSDEAPIKEDGLLTREMVAACLSHLKRTPILGDYVYIKLDLSLKRLVNIDILQYYKYLVYLDLSSNCLTEIHVLSHLLYLQYLSVDYNKLRTVLDYDTPQWFLTEVYYKYNDVIEIRDLSLFWSITILDLSHNKIKYIYGLENLRYLRRLDLSFNKIQRLENLNHLRLLWLDLSHNNISSFEFGADKGLQTLLHLEYLNLDENNLKSLKIFSGCTRLRELHACNNCFDILLELTLYMWKLRRLIILDLRLNPICKLKGYKDVIVNTFPILFQLDGEILDPVDIRTSKMDTTPDVTAFATRRLLRLLYIQQLSRAKVSPYVLPADTTDVPLVVLVGYEAVGKGTLARRIATECDSNIELAVQHTTSSCHFLGHYEVITRKNFDNMLLAGEFLTYSETDGESYGLSRKEAFVSNGKVKIVTMDLIGGALMLKLRGYRPYLILVSCSDKQALNIRQEERKRARNAREGKSDILVEATTLQVLLSGRIIINGILNEIVQGVASPEVLENEFILESDCSIIMESEIRPNKKAKGTDRLTLLKSSTSIKETDRSGTQKSSSLYSLYKPQDKCQYISDTYHGLQDKNIIQKKIDETKQNKQNLEKCTTKRTFSLKDLPVTKGVGSRKLTSKSVIFNPTKQSVSKESIAGILGPQYQTIKGKRASESPDVESSSPDFSGIKHIRKEEFCDQWVPSETYTATTKDDYEDIHRNCPGLFWDVVTMDDHDAAFVKLKKIVKNIFNEQKNLKPLYDIDFTNNNHYQTITKKIKSISLQIAPQRLFY